MKIGVLLSGGVDSSVALLRLKNYYPEAEVTAYYIKIWLEDELRFLGSCPWQEDLDFASSVCDALGIKLKIVSLQREYWDRVLSYTLAELKEGRTPSPDIFCNRRIKFGVFVDRVGESLDKVATGHYARVSEDSDGLFRLRCSPDRVKDQTYFLSHLTQGQASLAMFPLGDLKKSEVRHLAAENNLANSKRADSQGICFLGKIKYVDFLRHYLGEKNGDIIEAGTGCRLGHHKGSWFYTIGQRTGLGLSGGPWYVVARDRDENTITVDREPGAVAVARDCLILVDPSWISGEPERGRNIEVKIKLRHGPKMLAADLEWLEPIKGVERLKLRMSEADRGVAAGQFAVFYDGEVCLGGAKVYEDRI